MTRQTFPSVKLMLLTNLLLFICITLLIIILIAYFFLLDFSILFQKNEKEDVSVCSNYQRYLTPELNDQYCFNLSEQIS